MARRLLRDFETHGRNDRVKVRPEIRDQGIRVDGMRKDTVGGNTMKDADTTGDAVHQGGSNRTTLSLACLRLSCDSYTVQTDVDLS